MSERAAMQTKAAQTSKQAANGILQRKCACGTHSIAGSECEECGKQRLQTHMAVRPAPFDPPPDVHEARNASGQQMNSSMRGLMDSRFGSDFSRVPVRSEDGVGQTMRTPNNAQSRRSRHTRLRNIKSELWNLKNTRYTCPPVPDSYSNVISESAEDALGYTKFASTDQLMCEPEFTVDAQAGSCTIKQLPVSLSLISKFSKAEKEIPTNEKLTVPACKAEVPVFYTITESMAAMFKAGEQEHCGDLTRAFNQTLKPCTNALKKYEGQKIAGSDETECYNALTEKIGFDPLDCTEEFLNLEKKTKERDAKHWHDFDDDELISASCNKIVLGFKKSKTNKVGDPSVAPSKLIPAATQCPRAVASPSVSKPQEKTQGTKPPGGK